MEILPTITTIFDWRSKIQEVKNLGLKDVCLFLGPLNLGERRKLYRLLKTTNVARIPFVHARTDMAKDEFDYLIENYHTEAFNIHTKREYPYPPDYKQYKDMIYIENTYEQLDEKEIRQFAGICLDFAHLESGRRFRRDIYERDIKLIEKYGCGCNHISPIKDSPIFDKEIERSPYGEHPHTLKKLSELDYLKKYPKKYFGKFAALEMENCLGEQLLSRDYIAGML